MKLLLVLGLLSTVAVFSQAVPHCHMSELWSCVEITMDWLHSLPKRSLAATEAEVDVMCTELIKSTKCAFGYRDNCTTPLQKEIIGLLVEGGLALQKDFCTADSPIRTRYLEHSSCLNKVSQMDAVKEEIEYMIASLEKANSMPHNEIITYGCCGYAKSVSAFEKLGKEHCGQEAVDVSYEIINMGFAQLPQVICSGFDGEDDKCKAVLLPPGSKPHYNDSEICKFLRNIFKNWLE